MAGRRAADRGQSADRRGGGRARGRTRTKEGQEAGDEGAEDERVEEGCREDNGGLARNATMMAVVVCTGWGGLGKAVNQEETEDVLELLDGCSSGLRLPAHSHPSIFIGRSLAGVLHRLLLE